MGLISYNYGPKYTPSKRELKEQDPLERRRILLNSHLGTVIGEFKEIFGIFTYIWILKWWLLAWLFITGWLPSTLIYTMWITIVPAIFYIASHILLFITTIFGIAWIAIFGSFGWNIFYRNKFDEETYIELIKIV